MTKNTTTIDIRLVASLKRYSPETSQLLIQQDETISDILDRLGIDREMVQMAFVDGRFVDFETPLTNAGKVLLLPAIGGG